MLPDPPQRRDSHYRPPKDREPKTNAYEAKRDGVTRHEELTLCYKRSIIHFRKCGRAKPKARQAVRSLDQHSQQDGLVQNL